MFKDTDFLYVSARIKFLETKLLGKSAIERILDASGPEEAIKVLSDTEYGQDIAEMENVYDFDKVLDKSMKRTIKTLKESFKHHEYLRFFTIKNDFHNLKVVLKAQILGSAPDNNFSYLGEISPGEIKKYAQGDITAELPENMKLAYDQALEMYEATRDPQRVDLVVDQLLFEEMSKIVKSTEDPFLKEYLSALSDLTNIKTLLRLRKIDSDAKTLEWALLRQGSLSKEFFRQLLAGTAQTLIDAFESTPYYHIVNEGLTHWENTGSPAVLEKMIDNYLISLARKGLYKSYGPETVVGYLAAKENEIKLLRIIMVGKINGISSEKIRERLRDAYV